MRISVVIPLFNKRETVLRTINSVLSQTLLPREIIVVNDGSTDGSEQIVAKLDHPLVRLINQPNSGVSEARNTGIKNASYDWIAMLDADDYWNSNFLEEMNIISSEYPGFILYGSLIKQVDELNEGSEAPVLFKCPLDFSRSLYRYGPDISISSTIIHKDALLKVGLFPVDIKAGEDLITFFKLSFYGSFCISKKQHLFIDYPVPGERPLRTSFDEDILINNLEDFLTSNNFKDAKAVNYFKAFWYKVRSSTYLVHGYNIQSIKYALKGLNLKPFNCKLYIYVLVNLLPFSFGNMIFRQILIRKRRNKK